MFDSKNVVIILLFVDTVDILAQPATCNDDIHCSVGFFCHTMSHSCRECLNCEALKRRPGPNSNDCIKSDKQCGPCFPGLSNDGDHWAGMCFPPEAKTKKILTSHLYVLVTCVSTGVLLSLFIIHGIWNTRFIKVNIAITTHKKTSQSSNSKAILVKEGPVRCTA